MSSPFELFSRSPPGAPFFDDDDDDDGDDDDDDDDDGCLSRRNPSSFPI